MLSQQRADNKARKTTTEGRKHASRACVQCRRRKAKCDGVSPSCSTCVLYRDECTWAHEQDHRRTAKKGEVTALRERIKILETLLKQSGGNLEDEALTKTRTELLDSDDEASDEDAREVTNGAAINRLKIDAETLELTAYGPTSAFQHLPEPLPRRISTSPQSNALSRSPLPPTSATLHPLLHGMGSPPSGAIAPSPSSSSISASPAPESEVPDGPFAWNRNLPTLENWDQDLHDALIDAFFSYFNGWCYWVEERPFRHDMATCLSLSTPCPPSRTSYFSPLLHSALLAIACAYSDDPRTDASISTELVASAKRCLDDEGERPTIATLRGLLLVGSWHSGNGRQGSGNIFAGIALRMSQTLGLGIDSRAFVRSGILTESLQRSRDFAMWSAYLQDKLWSSYVGRNHTLLLSSLETPPPYIDTELDRQTWPVVRTGRKPSPGSITLCFHWTTRLAVLQEQVLSTLYGLRTNVHAAAVLNRVSELNLKLESWMSKLPDPLRIPPQLTKPPPAHIITLNCLYYFVVILLHRPYYNQTGQVALPINEAAIKRCNSAASRIVSLLELYQSSPGLRFAPVTMTQICFAAGTSHLLSSVNSSDRKALEAREAATCCVSALREMGKAWKCATQTGRILERLIDEWAPREAASTKEAGVVAGRNEEREAMGPDGEQTPVEQSVANPPGPSFDPESDLAKELVRLGWQPPASGQVPIVPEVSHPQVASSQPSYPLPSPQPNPLSLQHGFASAFSNPTSHLPYPPPYPIHPHHPYHPNPYDPSTSWLHHPAFQPYAPNPPTMTGAPPAGAPAAPIHAGPMNGDGTLPDDVFAGLLSFAGRAAIGGGGGGSTGQGGSEGGYAGANLSGSHPWWI
ncbi:hypothetical protein JCM10212_006610 [Sporobolomyces blumeae]